MSDFAFQSYGSQQWRLLRRNLRAGMSIEDAAPLCNMSIVEARMLAQIDAKNSPLPEEAFNLLYDPDAPAAASPTEAKEARMANDEDEGGGEYKRPDAALAFKIYDQQIKPKEAHLATIKGDMSEPYQQIKDNAHFPRKVLNFIVALENEEDAKRDHLLLALSEGLKHRKLYLPRDLVTMANGEDGAEIIPLGTRDDDELLVDEDEDEDLPLAAGEDFTEASDEEVAKQEGRGRGRKKADVAPGTGAAARSAMSKAASETAAMLQ